MRVLVIGAGQVGSTIVESLHDEHQLTVVDQDASKLTALAYRYDIATLEGNGASRQTLAEAGIGETDLVISCTSRDEVNLVASAFARIDAPRATTVIRTTNVEYIDLWHQGVLDVDFAVSSELETARAITHHIGLPAARQTDSFADGQVQIVEFDIEPRASTSVIDTPLREATIPEDSKVAAVIRPTGVTLPRGDEILRPGDRIVVIGSPEAAEEWSDLLAPGEAEVKHVVVYGGGQVGVAITRELLAKKFDVRVIEADRERAREIAEELPNARVFHATGLDPDFLEREQIGKTQVAVLAMRSDAKNHYAATLVRLHGVQMTIGVVHEPIATEVYEAAGVDVTVNPRQVTAEEIVRFAHDPRTQQVAMLEGDRFEILDITCRPTSEYVGKPFRQMPIRGALIGAIVRNGSAVFPHGDDILQAGDRVIVFTESSNVATVERAL